MIRYILLIKLRRRLDERRERGKEEEEEEERGPISIECRYGGDTGVQRWHKNRVSQRGATCATRKDRKRETVSFIRPCRTLIAHLRFHSGRTVGDPIHRERDRAAFSFFSSSFSLFVIAVSTIIPSRK